MLHPFFSLSFLSLLFSTTIADDSIAMSKLATALDLSVPQSWATDNNADYCKWNGIGCDASNRVVEIMLSNENLYGTLPSELSTLSHLQILYLQQNHLSGPLPSLANLSLLQELRLEDNSFSFIPQGFFQGLTSLTDFRISQNTNLDPWTIPVHIAESGSLIIFEATQANIEGTIPDMFASLPGLQNLDLAYNNLTGTLPASFANSAIQNLRLNYQQMGLSGTIDVLSSMTQLNQVWLMGNQFTGSIPDFSKCEFLFDLQLRENKFTGIVPASLITLPRLLNVSLSNNKLQGPVPEFPSNISLDIDANNFCVATPGVPCNPQVKTMLEIAGAVEYQEILSDSWRGNDPCSNWAFVTCDEQNISTINFGKQHFSGTISPAFVNLTALTNLYLNDNNLTGSIPDSLTKLTQLKVLDVSNNNLYGKIPAFSSSVKLIARPGNPSLGIDTGSGGNSTGKGSRGNWVLPSVISGAFIAVISFIAFGLLVLFKYNGVSRKVNHQENVTAQAKQKNCHVIGGHADFSMQLIRQVTDNFSENNILGKGGFGVVYKGELQEGTKIAVKRMKATTMANTKGMNEFQAEIAMLSKVRHRHLVSLLGYCVHGIEGFLVYEYMPRGTLAQHLFEWRERGYPPLTWKQRVSIALDVARGVEYLHSLAQQSLSFIHRDLKPSNILLGDDMRAKVSDFGFVKNAPDGKNSLVTRVAGTFGYLAPEYAKTGKVTRKVDVYAFGAILMEMITGKKAIDDTMEEEGWMHMHLVTWFREVLINKENISNAIDQAINPDEETLGSICVVAELAGHCTTPNRDQRPDMGHAVYVLAPLVEPWKPTSQEEEDQHTFEVPQCILNLENNI
ncbi:hypothetical protein P3X46_017854 [Hevea brasiliensis]|uniref:Protein kinase domain-containing protein n=1 Tax=Hevea brasiliensis TaxID=3981 RepID=A0ABQ9LR02_HEVBR|nr:receptor-like kinase TMK4 [Hevea brasiliensis]KAJ9169692.1 hypothetical protein P3X46_017854 [Hevea brasiliensis]